MQLIGLWLVSARAKHGRDHPHTAFRTVSTTLCLISVWPYGTDLPPESSNAEMSIAGPAAWVLSLPRSCDIPPRCVHSLQFVALSAAGLKESMASDLAGLYIFVMQIDGIHVTEHLVSLRSGSTTAAGSIRCH
jgi:hypothetical protein